jgi:hypothetical protein
MALAFLVAPGCMKRQNSRQGGPGQSPKPWCSPHLHDVHVLGLDVVEQPLVVRDHQRRGLVRLQAVDGVGHIPERINVQPCSNIAWRDWAQLLASAS